MKNSVIKKSFSIILAIVMLFTMVPAAVFAAGDEPPMIMQFTAASSGDFHSGLYYNKVYTVTFLDRIDNDAMNAAIAKWDLSANTGSGEVMSWIYLNEEATAAAGANRYDVYIAGEGGVSANPQSGFLFYFLSELVEVKGTEYFKTKNAVSFNNMFENCYKLKKVSFKGWNTENVTNMENMFRNCQVLEELDLSSFNIKKVTTMRFMFYLCKKLKNIYVGDGWSTESIANLYDGVFNCCYAIVGGTDDDVQNQKIYESNPNPPISGFYAQLEEDGGYLTYKAPEVIEKYTVTYEFLGDIIPDGVTAPAENTYEAGTTVDVAAVPSVEGYRFSGWSTNDAEIADGKVTVNNDIHLVGTWTRLYKVEYKYTDGYAVPEGAYPLPEPVYYAPGEDIDRLGVAYVDRHIFVGWSTKDVEVIGDMFTMPEHDVTFEGYYKIPVESIEFMVPEEDTVINVDDKVVLNVYVNPEDATIQTVVYESSDPSVAIIDKYNRVVGVGEGTVTITITSDCDPSKTDSIEITVKAPVTEIYVDKTELNLREDGTDKITATVNEDATNKNVIFESSNESVVKVDKDGNVTAVDAGEAVITVYPQDDPSKKVTVPVTVKNPVTDITVTDNSPKLEEGDEINLGAKVNDDATIKELTYEVDDAGIVKVDNEGNIVAVGEGTATITITSKDNPDITETVKVTVTKHYKVTYEIIGDVIPEGAEAPAEKSYLNGSEVKIEAELVFGGYTFSGWSTKDVADIADGKFIITKDVHFTGSFSKNVSSITVKWPDSEIPLGETKTVTVIVNPDDATDKTVIFESKDESIATVDKDGNVKALDEGETTIVIYPKDNPGLVVEIPVTVVIPVEKISTDKTYIELDVGDKDKIDVTVTPDNATDKSVTFESNNEGVVKVDKDGNVEAVGKGETVIVVSSNKNPDIKVEIPVKVNVPVDGITADKTELELTVGDKDKITVTVTPDDASDKSVTFESKDEKIVKVDENGNVVATGEGKTTITVTSDDDPTKKVEISVVVKKPDVPVTSFTVKDKEYKLEPGQAGKITAFVNEDATNKNITFESSDEGVVTVDQQGNIKATGEGEAIITVTPEGKPSFATQVKVTVKKPVITVTDITVDRSKIELTAGGKDKITVTVNPENATDKSVTFESKDESIVKVDEYGNIEAVGEGTTIIVVTSKSNTQLDTAVVVTVKPKESEEPSEPETPVNPGYTITVPGSVTILEGESTKLNVTVTPDDGKIKPVYSSTDESIVKVDANGVITGIAAGKATVNVDFGNGDIRPIIITVAAVTAPIKRSHYICFGKTDGIGWYEVSVNGGDFFPQGPNSTLEVEEGSVLVIRVQDMWIDDEFDFYVNGKKVLVDAANTITVTVDGYMLIGALSMDVPVPDVEESLTIFQRILNFFSGIINWFKNLFR